MRCSTLPLTASDTLTCTLDLPSPATIPSSATLVYNGRQKLRQSARACWAGRYAADQLASTDDIAETYFALYEQSPLGWSNEIDIRPFQEGWSC